MKLVKKVRLVFREGKSDKVYEVELAELPGAQDARFLVNFRYGRRGSSLREGTKTPSPLSLAEAEATYRSVVVSKTNAGYYDEAGPAPVRAVSAPKQGSRDSIQDARRSALLQALAAETKSKQRARIIWNLGQNPPTDSAASTVLAHLGRGDWIEDYSIAWTLGRWRDATHVAALEKLSRHSNTIVRDIAIEALLLTITPASAANLLQTERRELPPPLLAAVEAGDHENITRLLRSMAQEQSPALNQSLIALYRLALFAAPAQRALLAFFADCALAPGIFKGIRHVFKTAELRLDYEMFARLTHRFETTHAFFRHQWDRVYIPGQGSLVVAKELAREHPRLAYSNRTRLYLRRRAWRAMHRLGRADSPHYVAMAKALLLQVSDDDAVEPRTREVHRWNEDEGRRRKAAIREYGPYAHLLAFNHILHGADRAYRLSSSGAAWFRSGRNDTAARGEAYQHLWNAAPAAALDLLKSSRCSAVHDAAIRMLVDQPQFLQTLSAGELAQLLVSIYPQTVEFALPLARALFERGMGDDHLLLALLRSPLAQAREFGAQILTGQPNWVANAPLLIELLLVFASPIPELVDSALGASPISDITQQQVVAGVIGQLSLRSIELTAPQGEALARVLSRHFPAAVGALPLTLVDRLLSHSDVGRQLLGARLLVDNSIGFKDIPDRLLQHIHGSPHDEVRAIAIALLSKQTPDDLLQQADMLAELWYRGAALERRELLTLFGKLAAHQPADEARVLQALSGLLFRAEREPGQADELCSFFLQHHSRATEAFDQDMVWRLLQAQATAAQRVGAALLQGRSATDFSVRQWARLAHHPDVSARRYAMAAFESHLDVVKQNTRDALRLLDSPWDDAREFGFAFFRSRFDESDWSPEYIVGICDSTVPDVQAFGREVLQRFFQQAQGPQYLTTLSEHPSVNVQLFVSNFLEQHAAGHSDRILALRGYFVTVLSQINKARVTKDRVLQFLLREALRDGSVAAMVGEIFTELSLTVVRKDRSELIKAMIAMRSAFPDLSLPIKALGVRSHTAPEASRGV